MASGQTPAAEVIVQNQTVCDETANSPKSPACPSFRDSLHNHGLGDLDIDSCELSERWKAHLLQLIQKYEDVFSRSKVDGGLAKDFVHCIHLSNERPFRLPYQGSICSRNAHTKKDAHPLPHQFDCLAALGGNAIFIAMDLTSEFYNIAIANDDKKLTAFTTPMGLYAFNRLPQGLCNSPASSMRLMMGIFGDQNFLTLLCYIDDALVYAPMKLKPSGGLKQFSVGSMSMD